MRIVFMGTPDFSLPALEALAASGHDIIAVYSQPPRKAGRGQKLRLSPVHQLAEIRGWRRTIGVPFEPCPCLLQRPSW